MDLTTTSSQRHLSSWLRISLGLVFLLTIVSRGLAQNGAVSVTQSFSYTGQLVTWQVPAGVTSLTITARGAEGGNNSSSRAGKGALISGVVPVSSGQSLKILVGQQSPARNGGGGGSFVTTSANEPLLIAGGGGGSGESDNAAKDGQTGTAGGSIPDGGAGGQNGQGGGQSPSNAGSGGGLLTDGASRNVFGTTPGGRAFINGGGNPNNGQNESGIGGVGGGGTGTGVGSGGGGGGYSGGGGGGSGVGGGGGSYNAGTSLTAVSGVNTGNGLVSITYTPPPPTITNFTVSPGSACVGDAITASLTVGNVSGSYSYTLTETNSGATYQFTTSDNPASISFVYDSPGVRNYALRVVSNGQEATAGPRTVTINALPTQYNVTGSGSYCSNATGRTVGLSGSQSGVSYQLLQSGTPLGSPLTGTGSALNFGPQPAGTYTVRATNTSTSCQQTMTGSAVITAAQPPTVTLSNDGPITCTKPSVTLTAGGGNTYAFSAGAAQVNGGNTATVTAAGTYTVTATNATNGCSSFTTTSVSANTATPSVSNPAVTTATQNVTFSQTFTASGGTAPYSFSLESGTLPDGLTLRSDGVLSGSPSQSGSFSVTIRATGANGCSGVGAVYTLTVSPQVTGAPTLATPASGTTTNSLPSFSGNAVSNSTVMVYVSGTSSQTLTTQTNAQGLFSVPATSALASGTYSAYAVAMLGGQTSSAPSNTNGFTVDATPPGVTLSASVGNGTTTMTQPTSFTATFSEAVTGFSPSGISVSNGQVSSFIGSGASYSFNVMATNPGQVSVSLGAGVAQDGVGNGNTASNTYSFTYQQPMTGRPMVNTPANGAQLNTRQPTYQGTAPLGSLVTVFVNNNSVGTTTATTGSFSLQQSSALPDGAYQVYVTAQLSGQTISDASAVHSFTIDATQPGVSLNASQVASGGTTASAAVAFSANFTEPVTSFSASGVQVDNGSVSSFMGDGASYSFQVTANSAGPVHVSIVANAARDAAGNGNMASPSYGYLYQPTPPPPTAFTITGARITDCQLDDPSRSKRYRVSLQPQYAGQDNTQPTSFSVANELSATTTPGPYIVYLWGDNQQITLVAKQPSSAQAHFAYRWQADCPAINGGTLPPTQPQPPTTVGTPNQRATLNQPYSLDVRPYFTDPAGQPLTFTSTALPAGLSLNGSVISGSPSQSGVYGVTVTATNPDNLTVASSFQLTIDGAPTTPPASFTITGATITSCSLDDPSRSKRYRVSLQPQYAGQDNTQPTSFSVANELSATSAPGPYTVYLWGDNQQITLVAKQPSSAEARFAYRWQADCPAINGAPRRGAQAETGHGLQVRLLGNPISDGRLRLELQGVAGQSAELRLISLTGQLLSQTPVGSVIEGEPLTLDVHADWGSVLLLQVSSAGQQQTLKVIQAR